MPDNALYQVGYICLVAAEEASAFNGGVSE
jgi:hypothetical protein